jgi:guanylate kinase
MQNDSTGGQGPGVRSRTGKRKGTLIVVSGPSGVGKSTLIEKFLKEDRNASFSVSYTTRQKRKGEIDGRDYYFIDEERFVDMSKKGSFLEWENVHGHFYGTPKKEILEALRSGKDIVLDIDVKGAINVKREYPDACLIFIAPPSKAALLQRLSFRKEKEIDVRMQRIDEEFEKKQFFEYTVVNDDLEEAYGSFKQIIQILREKTYGKDNR